MSWSSEDYIEELLVVAYQKGKGGLLMDIANKIQIDKNSTIVILANTAYQSLILEKLNKIGLRGRLFNANLVELNFFN